jgi:uncharacterized protein (TIGR04552 family)
MSSETERSFSYRTLDEFRLADLEAVQLVLRGGSIIDWRRLNFGDRDEAIAFIRAQEFLLDDPGDLARIDSIKNEAIDYLRRNFDYPIPQKVARLDVIDLLMVASGKGHLQLCACVILKVMHIIHHLEAHELLFMLPISNQEVFVIVEEKIYRVVGAMLAKGFPIIEFIGGRKNKDSLFTKLLSKPQTTAANIYDKLRFRMVVRSRGDIFPIINYLLHHVFPFNYVLPGQSINTLCHLRSFCEEHPHLAALYQSLRMPNDSTEEIHQITDDNQFSSSAYRVEHFVIDMPIRLSKSILDRTPPATRELGPVVFVQTEFQIIDSETERENEQGEASHAAYKFRQKEAVLQRLKASGKRKTEPPG